MSVLLLPTPPIFFLLFPGLAAFLRRLATYQRAERDSLFRNHAPPLQATETVPLFAAPGALPLLRVHLTPLVGGLPRSPVNVVPGTMKWDYEWGYEMSTAENTPGVRSIHQDFRRLSTKTLIKKGYKEMCYAAP